MKSMQDLIIAFYKIRDAILGKDNDENNGSGEENNLILDYYYKPDAYFLEKIQHISSQPSTGSMEETVFSGDDIEVPPEAVPEYEIVESFEDARQKVVNEECMPYVTCLYKDNTLDISKCLAGVRFDENITHLMEVIPLAFSFVKFEDTEYYRLAYSPSAEL